MSDLPERVWLDNSALEPAIKHAWRAGWWQGQASKLHTHEYVRADALAASQAEAERLREALTATLTASQPQGGE
jgi:glycine/D-amino acid oxidase-like deaminating enzyme